MFLASITCLSCPTDGSRLKLFYMTSMSIGMHAAFECGKVSYQWFQYRHNKDLWCQLPDMCHFRIHLRTGPDDTCHREPQHDILLLTPGTTLPPPVLYQCKYIILALTCLFAEIRHVLECCSLLVYARRANAVLLRSNLKACIFRADLIPPSTVTWTQSHVKVVAWGQGNGTFATAITPVKIRKIERV